MVDPEFATAPSRIVGIDYGRKRIGVSISDPSHLLARPLFTIQATKSLEETAKKVAEELTKVGLEEGFWLSEVVVGIPLMLSGKAGDMAEEVKKFVALLDELLPGEVVTWDERLTSMQATRLLQETGMKRKKRAKVIDEVAAVIILQSYLDHRGITG